MPTSFEYIRPARAEVPKVALLGEDVVVYWEMFNARPEAFETRIPNDRFGDLLSIAAIESPVDVRSLSLRLIGFDQRHANGTVTSPAPLPTSTLRLLTGEAFYARAKLLGLSEPGFYRLRIRPAFEGYGNVSDFVEFELRPLTGRGERAEFQLRRLWDAWEPDARCKHVRPAAKALLAVHPRAVAAYEQLGACAVNERRVSPALSAYAHALELLDGRLDDLYVETHRPDEIQRRAAVLREKVRALRSGRLPPPDPVTE